MPTHIIVDGYNLLGVWGQVGRSAAGGGEAVRDQLVRDLALYRQRKGHAVTVVFDGWQQGGGSAHREFRSGIEVVFSPRGCRADQVIQRLVEEHGRDCAVVSSDREVAGHARVHGAFVISAQEFAGRLRERPATASRARFAASPLEDRDTEPASMKRPEKKGNPRKLPKTLRQRNRHLRGF